MMDVNMFEGIRIGIASPDKIRSWSYEEVFADFGDSIEISDDDIAF